MPPHGHPLSCPWSPAFALLPVPVSWAWWVYISLFVVTAWLPQSQCLSVQEKTLSKPIWRNTTLIKRLETMDGRDTRTDHLLTPNIRTSQSEEAMPAVHNSLQMTVVDCQHFDCKGGFVLSVIIDKAGKSQECLGDVSQEQFMECCMHCESFDADKSVTEGELKRNNASNGFGQPC